MSTHSQTSPQLVGTLKLSDFDDVLTLENDQTMTEITAIAKNVAAQTNVKLSQAMTTLINAAGLAVRDADQARPILLQRALLPFNETVRVTKLSVVTVNNTVHVQIESDTEVLKIEEDSSSWIGDTPPLEELLDTARWLISSTIKHRQIYSDLYKRQRENPKQKFTQAVQGLLKIAMERSGGGRAAAQVLLSLYNGSAYQCDLTDLNILDPDNHALALEAIRWAPSAHVEPQSVIKDGDNHFQTLIGLWPELYSRIRHARSFVEEDEYVEVWGCPKCSCTLPPTLKYPDWIRAKTNTPTCLGTEDNTHEEVTMVVKQTYRLELKELK